MLPRTSTISSVNGYKSYSTLQFVILVRGLRYRYFKMKSCQNARDADHPLATYLKKELKRSNGILQWAVSEQLGRVLQRNLFTYLVGNLVELDKLLLLNPACSAAIDHWKTPEENRRITIIT